MPPSAVAAAEDRIRAEIRAWLADALGPDWGTRRRPSPVLAQRIAEGKAWQRELARGGWLGLGWPEEHGGRPATAGERLAVAQELALARAPEPADIFGQVILGPTLLTLGSEDQRRRFLPPILAGDVMWCETWSEPDHGSDMANIQTRGELEGDELVITGRKRWNSLAQFADWTMLLCRTGAPQSRQRGISFVLVDLSTPGIDIHTLPMLTGDARETEVSFERVRVPIENVVGAIDGGWAVVMHALTHQRAIGVGELVPRLDLVHRDVMRLARETGRAGRPALEDPLIRQRLAQSAIEIDALRRSGDRAYAAAALGRPAGSEVSTAKLHWSESEQRLQRLAIEILGLQGQLLRDDPQAVDDGIWSHYFLWSHALTIHSGSSEIQRGILAERVLGLPRSR